MDLPKIAAYMDASIFLLLHPFKVEYFVNKTIALYGMSFPLRKKQESFFVYKLKVQRVHCSFFLNILEPLPFVYSSSYVSKVQVNKKNERKGNPFCQRVCVYP